MTKQMPNPIKITPELIIMARAERCKRSFYYFVERFWSTVVTQPLVSNWHIEELCDRLQVIGQRVIKREPKLHDMIVNVPPGTSKSTICSILFPAWLWCQDSSISIISASYSMTIAMELSTKSRDVIKSDLYQQYFPDVVLRQDVDAKTNYSTTKNGSRYTTSTGGSVTGLHADIIILDDPQNPMGAESEADRRTTNEWTTGTLTTRKRNHAVTPTVIVQQRLHPEDVTGYVLSREHNWEHISLPAELTETCKPIPAKLESKYVNGLLDPIRLNREVLEELKSKMGSRNYSAQMGQNPQDSADSIIKRSWLPIVDERPMGIVNFWIDTAYTTKTNNDCSAIVATIYDPTRRNLVIVNAWKGRLESPQLAQQIMEWVKLNGYTQMSKLKIEPKAAGQSIIPMLRSSTDLNVSESKVPTKSKLEMLYLVAPQFESLRISMVRGPWNHLVTDELFTDIPAHDDVRDCVVMAVNETLVDMPNYGTYNFAGFTVDPTNGFKHTSNEELIALSEGFQPDYPTHVKDQFKNTKYSFR